MILSFFGGAQTVTGSKHLITLQNEKRILLDCGMFQGKGSKTEKLNEEFYFDASTIDYLILSHAHIDHCGLVPKLGKKALQEKYIVRLLPYSFVNCY